MLSLLRKGLKSTPKRALVGLDIGTSKVAYAVGYIENEAKIKVIGASRQESKGLKNGVIIDIDGLTRSISSAVLQVEKQLRKSSRRVFVSLSPAITTSLSANVETEVVGQSVMDSDLKRLIDQACKHVYKQDEVVIHLIPRSYSINQAKCIHEPYGMVGSRLGADFHIVSAMLGPLKNLKVCVEQCKLDILSFVMSSYASGLATLFQDEANLGVTLLDMGAGTTSISTFYDGKLHHADSIPIGGNHVTSDIARILSTSLDQAENIKTHYGSISTDQPSREEEEIIIPQLSGKNYGKGEKIVKSDLSRIIRPRIEETFEIIRDRLRTCDMTRLSGKNMVLTGGASQLSGVLQLGNLILGKNGRIGRPIRLLDDEENEEVKNPSFSTCIGLMVYAMETQSTKDSRKGQKELRKHGSTNSFLKKFGAWLEERL